MSYTVDVVRELWDDSGNKIITIRPDADGLDMVELAGPDGGDRIVIPTEAIASFVTAVQALAKDLAEPTP